MPQAKGGAAGQNWDPGGYLGDPPPPGSSLAAHYALGRRSLQVKMRRALLPGATKTEFERWILDREPWAFFARQDQLPPPGDWSIWLFQAGRGAGKTRAGSEWSFGQAANNERWQVGVMSPTNDDLTRVTFDGPSGLMRLVDRHRDKVSRVAKRPWQVDFRNGSKILSYTGESYERLRGPNHMAFWSDEMAGMARVASQAFEQIMFGLRIGKRPRLMLTTTPRTIPLFRRLNDRAMAGDPAVAITRAATMDNAANLSAVAIAELRASYEGTRLGRQELMGELLRDVPGALWTPEMIQRASMPDHLDRIVIGVDPSGAADAKSSSDEIGIVAAGLRKGRTRAEDRYFVLEDATLIGSPQQWGRRVVTAFDGWEADRVVAETNYGGAMVAATIKAADENVPVRLVTASRGKAVRAEPVSALYEQGRVFMVGQNFAKLEDQLCNMTATGYVGEGSPDRADAMVWALSDLMTEQHAPKNLPLGSLDSPSYWRPS